MTVVLASTFLETAARFIKLFGITNIEAANILTIFFPMPEASVH